MTSEATPPKPPPAKPEKAAPAQPLVRLAKPYFYISAYYFALAFGVWLALRLWPGLMAYLPIGGAAAFGAVGDTAFEAVDLAARAPSVAFTESITLAVSIAGAFALMLPVTWICMGARRRKDVSQSFVQTILILPMVIAGIVHVVHNSLALAFSLAGIVAGVRFRHTLKDSAETTYLFTSIAVGVACGINAVEIAAIISVFFNYTVLGLWATDYGERNTGKSMFSREWMGRKDPRREGDDDEKKPARDDDDD